MGRSLGIEIEILAEFELLKIINIKLKLRVLINEIKLKKKNASEAKQLRNQGIRQII